MGVTVKDVARAAGVSTATGLARCADDNVDPRIREQVLLTTERLGTGSHAAAALSTGEPGDRRHAHRDRLALHRGSPAEVAKLSGVARSVLTVVLRDLHRAARSHSRAARRRCHRAVPER